jgi:hypothetical protein
MGYNHLVLPEIELDDVLRLRKPHPCGGYDWKVIRLGADIGLECTKCQRRVLLSRRELVRRYKSNLTREAHDPPVLR